MQLWKYLGIKCHGWQPWCFFPLCVLLSSVVTHIVIGFPLLLFGAFLSVDGYVIEWREGICFLLDSFVSVFVFWFCSSERIYFFCLSSVLFFFPVLMKNKGIIFTLSNIKRRSLISKSYFIAYFTFLSLVVTWYHLRNRSIVSIDDIETKSHAFQFF